MPIEKVEPGLAALEAQPRVTRMVLLRRIAEAWLEARWGRAILIGQIGDARD